MAKPTNSPISSPLVSAFNNIVNINRSKSTMRSTQNSYNEFLRFMNVEIKNIKAIKLPEEKKVKKLANLNVASTFGSAGSLLSSLVSGALDAAGLVGSFFGGGDKNKAGKPIPKNKGIRLGGVRAIGVANAVFAGLDFATGLAQGESVGKSAAGTGGALAGSLLGGAIGQSLIPIPGLGFVIGSMAGNFLGGYLADRGYEAATGEGKVKEKVKAKLKQQEQKQKLEAAVSQATLPQVLDKFDSVVTEFQRAADRGLLGPTSGDYDGTEDEDANKEPMEPNTPPLENNNKQTGETGDYSVSGGTLPSSKRGSPYGPRWGRTHYGVDYEVDVGTPISVIQPGTVAFSGLDSGGNLSVYVDHVDGSHTRYLHLSKTAVSQGQKIEPGTLIGYSGGAAGAYGSGNSTGPHLHFEYAPRGSGSVDPAQGNNDDKYFRFGGSIQVKPKVKSQTGVMGDVGKPTAVLAAGTNDYGSPQTAKANVEKAIKELQQKGYNVVVVPPNEKGKFGNVSKAVQEAAASSGATVEKGKYETTDPLHLDPNEAKRIREKYKGAKFIGDSNAVRLAGGGNVAGQRVEGVGTADILQFARGTARVAPAAQATSQVQSMPRQLVAPQQLEKYPDYNTPQNSVTIIPMMMGSSGGGSQQRPMVISSGNGGGTTVMPPVPQSQLLNSYFNTMLLTNLSGT